MCRCRRGACLMAWTLCHCYLGRRRRRIQRERPLNCDETGLSRWPLAACFIHSLDLAALVRLEQHGGCTAAMPIKQSCIREVRPAASSVHIPGQRVGTAHCTTRRCFSIYLSTRRSLVHSMEGAVKLQQCVQCQPLVNMIITAARYCCRYWQRWQSNWQH